MNNVTTINKAPLPALAMDENELMAVLRTSLYPGAKDESIRMAIGYCRASGLDPMQKPVHIVPMWDGKAKQMRDVIMPGVNLYRTQAARSGALAGVSEPEFGPDATETIGGVKITYPTWCRVVVKRQLPSGVIAEFAAIEFWVENYAVKGGAEKSVAPNAMWAKRPRGQIAKCAQAQALRIAFPELGGALTAEEMEGKVLNDIEATPPSPPKDPLDDTTLADWKSEAAKGTQFAGAFWKAMGQTKRSRATEEQKVAMWTIAESADAMRAEGGEPGDQDADGETEAA